MKDSTFPEDTVLVSVGNAVQLDMGDYDASSLQCAGKVSDEDLSFVSRTGYNYVGNPFPSALDIQNIQLDSEISSFEVSFQFLTSKRRNAGTYDWISAEDAGDYVDDWPEGLGLWVKDSQYPETTVTIAPGGAVQLDMGNDYDQSVVNVYSPIEL